ncbi:MAG: hypothetical protein KGI25_06860, partial [Thaumarchaeota archaeon]|nr:hypothetical protein [Nitrososphaerota archaeon]
DSTGMSMSLLVCNPSIVPITLDAIEIDLGGSSGSYGSLLVPGKVIAPLSRETLQGRLDFTDFSTMETTLDWVLNNQTNADFNATGIVKEKLFGVISYSYEKNYDLSAFSNLLIRNGPSTCQAKNHSQDIQQQLILAQARMSAASLLYSDKIGLGNGTNDTQVNMTVP